MEVGGGEGVKRGEGERERGGEKGRQKCRSLHFFLLALTRAM